MMLTENVLDFQGKHQKRIYCLLFLGTESTIGTNSSYPPRLVTLRLMD